MNDPGYVDTVGSKLVSHHADSPMQSVVAPDLEPWKLELIAKAQITYRFLFWTISVVIVFGMVLFSLRARLDRQIRQISVIWTELASFGGLIIYVSNIYLRGWPPETTGSGCFVPFWGKHVVNTPLKSLEDILAFYRTLYGAIDCGIRPCCEELASQIFAGDQQS
ncbi:hypothetical protein BJ742DRAFT_53891 [Cladochytrium replicatum]|nr:hypothetical protein BJ742DRAFT_53891 [Cladochytrium replicatum]